MEAPKLEFSGIRGWAYLMAGVREFLIRSGTGGRCGIVGINGTQESAILRAGFGK